MSDEAKFTQAQVDALIKDRLAQMKGQRDAAREEAKALQARFDEQAAEVVNLGKQIQTFEAAQKHTEGIQGQLAEANARWEAAQAVSAMGLGLSDTASLRALYSAAPVGEDGKRPAFGDWLKAEAEAEGSFVSRVVGASKAPAAEPAPPAPVVPKVPAPSPVAGVQGQANGTRAYNLQDMSPADIVRLSQENPQAYMQAIGLTLPGASG